MYCTVFLIHFKLKSCHALWSLLCITTLLVSQYPTNQPPPLISSKTGCMREEDTAFNHQVQVRWLTGSWVLLPSWVDCDSVIDWELGQSQHAVRGQTAVDIRGLISLPGDAASDLGHGAVRAGRPAALLTCRSALFRDGCAALLMRNTCCPPLDFGVTRNTKILRLQKISRKSLTHWACALFPRSLYICGDFMRTIVVREVQYYWLIKALKINIK